ncbi:MAG: hypothetical protein K0U41_09975, partial [Gammaproteobacteria bacterium]|nr:hypothetical protein [Gammaproteobacteria bacterium]
MRILTTISNYLDEASGVEIFTVTAIIVLLLFIYPIIQAVISFRVKKIFPSFHRLLLGLSGRKIAIFATHDIFTSLESMLIDSKLFTKKEILQIQADSIDKAENSSLFLVYWPDFNDNLDAILAIKKDATALVVYAPQDKGRI